MFTPGLVGPFGIGRFHIYSCIAGVLLSVSAASAVAVEPDWSKLIISEIYYHPPGTNGVDGDEYEFIELMNTGSSPLDLRGVSFTGISALFIDLLVVEPGRCAVFVSDPVRFAERFGDVKIDGVYGGRLDNSGETIALISPTAGVITAVSYQDSRPWPVQADGGGYSLQRLNTSTNASLAANWFAAAPTPGVPTAPELIDTDADGMPDVWELAHGFDINDRTDATADTDGDRLNNLGEFLAGTDPRNAADYLRFTSVGFERTPLYRIVTLTFTAVANKNYSLYVQVGQDGCWLDVGYFGARPTNRVETVRQVIYPGSIPYIYHLGTPAGQRPPCDDGEPD